MSDYKRLHEIKDYDKKIIEFNGDPRIYDFRNYDDLSKDKKFCVGRNFNQTLWREAQPELPSRDEWYSNNYDFIMINFFTRKERLRRYIQHLADIVNGEWKRNTFGVYWAIAYDNELIAYLHDAVDDSIKFRSEDAALKIIEHASKELKELYGVSDE